MTHIEPIYRAENCSFAYPLSWVLSIFWRQPMESEDWFTPLNNALERDGIRLINHQFSASGSSQFLITSKPEVSPSRIVQRIKGRLQHVIREDYPKALRRHFAIRSVGKVRREVVQKYVASQLDHHPMADWRVEERFKKYCYEKLESYPITSICCWAAVLKMRHWRWRSAF